MSLISLAKTILDKPELWGDLSLSHDDLETLRIFTREVEADAAVTFLKSLEMGSDIGSELGTWNNTELAELLKVHIWGEMDITDPRAAVLSVVCDRLEETAARLAAADEVAAQLARLEKHYIFGDEEYCDWCEAPPHADDCPFAVLTRGEGKTIESALTAADALAAVLVLGNQAIKGAIQHVPPTVENHEWLALAAIVEERADAALRAYYEARGETPRPVGKCLCGSSERVVVYRRYRGIDDFQMGGWFVECASCHISVASPFDTEPEARAALAAQGEGAE